MSVGELRWVLRQSGVLGAAGGEPAPAELADALWLAALRRSGRPAPPASDDLPPTEEALLESEDESAAEEPIEEFDPERTELPVLPEPDSAPLPDELPPRSPVYATLPVRGGPSAGLLVSAAARPQLPQALALARAMRPLRRRVQSATRYVLDEEATADLRAEQRLWLPALVPDSEPAFDLALVLDDSASMALWSEKVREFRLLCERVGAFRDVRVWRLGASGDDRGAEPVLRALSRSSGTRDQRELIDPSGRRLILVITDGVHPWWRPSGPLRPVLARWALASPLAIVQPFPQRLWERGPLRPVTAEFGPGWPGSGPTIHRAGDGHDGQRSLGSVAVPILELSPAAMRRWAGIISGTSGLTRLPAAALPRKAGGGEEQHGVVRNNDGEYSARPDPVRLVREFRASVSPAAYQLAGYLSAAPLTLPVMRLVQESMMPETGPAELAEVFLSGLVLKSADTDPRADPEGTSYVFAAGVRDALQSTLTRGEALDVLDQVGGYLIRGRRGGRPFPVLLRGRPDGGDIVAAAERFPEWFGRISGGLLERIGGPYANAVRELAEPDEEAVLAPPTALEEPAGRVFDPSTLASGKLYQPMLFVGLGGTGCDIGAELERRLRDAICGPDGNDFRRRSGKDALLAYQLPSCVQFVYADLNRSELHRLPERVVPGAGHLAAAGATAGYVQGPAETSYPDLARRLRLEAGPVVDGWLPPASQDEPRVHPLQGGSGQFPTVARAALFGTLLEGRGAIRAIDAAVGKLSASGEDLLALGGRPPHALDVFVAFSVAGGTGAGIFYDYLHMIDDIVRRQSGLRARIYPLAVMPSAFPEGLGGGRPGQLNAGQALLDLFRLVDKQAGAQAEAADGAVTYPGRTPIVMAPGTLAAPLLFSRPATATREDMRRSIASLVLSLVGTQPSADDSRADEHFRSFADSFVGQLERRQVAAENRIGGRGVSTALVASLSVPVDEIAAIIASRLLSTAISQIAVPGSGKSTRAGMEEFLAFARGVPDDFARRSDELYRKRFGVSYLLPSGSGRMEQFYQQVVRLLTDRLASDQRIGVNSSAADLVTGLVGAGTWAEVDRVSVEESPERAVEFLRERVHAEIAGFLLAPAPGELPLLPRLRHALVDFAGQSNSLRRVLPEDYLPDFAGKLAGLAPADFTPAGSGPLKVLVTYPADAPSGIIERFLERTLKLPSGPGTTHEFRATSADAITVVLLRTTMGVADVDEVRDLLGLWASAEADPQPADQLRWRQRTGYDLGYLPSSERETTPDVAGGRTRAKRRRRLDPVGPFGNPDGSRADIEDVMSEFVDFGGNPAYGHLASRANDSSVRVIVGKLGTGKTVYLRRFQDFQAHQDSVYADVPQTSLPKTEVIVKACQWFPDRVLVEKWMQIWERAIMRSLASHLLRHPELRQQLRDEEADEIEQSYARLLGDFRRPRSIYSQVRDIVNQWQTASQLSAYLDDPLWDDLEDLLGEVVSHCKPVYFYLDAVDEEFSHAPMYWLKCQEGLFYQVMRLLRDQRLGRRLHVVVCVPDIVLSSVYRSEHAPRYYNEPHIRVLTWDRGSLLYLLGQKLRRLPPSVLMRRATAGAPTISDWLGVDGDSLGPDGYGTLEDYLLSHTRLIPRDIISLGNELSEEVLRQKQAGRDGLPVAALQGVVQRCAKRFGDSQLAQCANQVSSDLMPQNAALHDYSELFTSTQAYISGVEEDVRSFVQMIGVDRFSPADLAALRELSDLHFERATDLAAVLWQNGLLGYVDGSGRHRFYSMGDIDQFHFPADAGAYVLHPCLVNAVGGIQHVREDSERGRTAEAGQGGGIFVSYRRQENSQLVGRLYGRLADRFGAGQVFIDANAIEPGIDFAEGIFRAVTACKVLLTIIGPAWLSAADEHGRRRLDNPDDIVRLEIEAALARGVRAIPVLVEGAIMPAQDDLPESLADLARGNALVIRHETFPDDSDRLVAAIERALAASGEAAQQGSGPTRIDVSLAARLLDDAERIAASITDESWKAWALRAVAEALAATDPDRAERIAASIAVGSLRASTLSEVAKALAAADPDRAARLFTDAERIAASITDESSRASTLSEVAKALTAADPDRAARLFTDAERIAVAITDESSIASALRGVAEALAAIDPDRAERIAISITDESWRAAALRGVAEALAATDPDRAERIANSITDESWKAWALRGVAEALAATDPDRAERIAAAITREGSRASALSEVAKALAAADPDRAARLFTDAERIATAITVESSKASALRRVAEALAATDPDRAERIAAAITDESSRAPALSEVAKALAATDPDRAARLFTDAERIATAITDESSKASALSEVATALAATSS